MHPQRCIHQLIEQWVAAHIFGLEEVRLCGASHEKTVKNETKIIINLKGHILIEYGPYFILHTLRTNTSHDLNSDKLHQYFNQRILLYRFFHSEKSHRMTCP